MDNWITLVCVWIPLTGIIGLMARDSFHPAVLWMAFWSAQYLLALVLPTSGETSPSAMIFLCCNVVTLSLGALTGSRFGSAAISSAKTIPKVHTGGVIAVAVISILAAGIIAFAILDGVSEMGGATADAGLANQISTMRYTQERQSSATAIENIGRLVVYMCCGVSGYLRAVLALTSHGGGKRMLRPASLVPLAALCFLAALTTEKFALLGGLSLWLTMYLLAKRQWGGPHAWLRQLAAGRPLPSRTGMDPRLILRRSMLAVASLAGVGMFVLLTLYLRYDGEGDTAHLVTMVMSDYLVAHLTNWSAWFEMGMPRQNYWGHTFQFMGSWVGYGERPPGLYEFISTGAFQVNSNIFTMFRGVIEDFGLDGAFAFLFIFGFISGFCYARVKWRPDCGIISAYGFAACQFSILLSFTTFPLGFTTFLLAPLVACAVVPRLIVSPENCFPATTRLPAKEHGPGIVGGAA